MAAEARSAPVAYAEPGSVSTDPYISAARPTDPYVSVAQATDYATVTAGAGFTDWRPDAAFPPGGYGAYPSMTRDYPAYLSDAQSAAAAEPGFHPGAPVPTGFVPPPTPHAGAMVRREPVYAAPTRELFHGKSLPVPTLRNYQTRRHPNPTRDVVYQGEVASPFIRRGYAGESSYNQRSLHGARVARMKQYGSYVY